MSESNISLVTALQSDSSGTMSLIRTVQHDISSAVQSPISLQPLPPLQPSIPQLNEPPPEVEVRSPPNYRRVFEAAPIQSMSKPRKIAIAVFIVTSNLVQIISAVLGITSGLAIAGVTGPKKANWIAVSYPLTQGTFVLVSGRLGAVYGHKNVLLAGGVWFVLWSLINGFCNDFISFNIARASTGVGGALIMPNAVAIIGVTYQPGKFRNLSLGFFSASAPIGEPLGTILCGVIMKYASWKWIFFCVAILGTCVFGTLWALLPPEIPVDRGGNIDWIGGVLGTSGLITFNFVWNQAPAVGWSTPYEIVLLVCSVIFVCVFCVWESKFARTSIMPLDIWHAPSFLPTIVVVLLCFMSFGTMLWYMISWQQLIRHWSVLDFAIGWISFILCGASGAVLAAWLIPRLDAQWIFAFGAATVLISNLLFATMPEQQTYWAQVFPTTIVMASCPDLVYTAAQIIASNSVKRHQQGIAASLIGTLNLYGNSLGIGFAGTVETELNKRTRSLDPIKGYRAALSFGIGIAAVAMMVDVLFVTMAKDTREGRAATGDEYADDDGEPHAVSKGTVLGRVGSMGQ